MLQSAYLEFMERLSLSGVRIRRVQGSRGFGRVGVISVWVCVLDVVISCQEFCMSGGFFRRWGLLGTHGGC